MKCAVYPTSHSFPIYSSELEANYSMMCARVASSGKSEFFRLQVCEDFMLALFGRSTCMPFFVGFMFMIGMSLWIYWSTVSSSKIFFLQLYPLLTV